MDLPFLPGMLSCKESIRSAELQYVLMENRQQHLGLSKSMLDIDLKLHSLNTHLQDKGETLGKAHTGEIGTEGLGVAWECDLEVMKEKWTTAYM